MNPLPMTLFVAGVINRPHLPP
jgi:hypothetical protein